MLNLFYRRFSPGGRRPDGKDDGYHRPGGRYEREDQNDNGWNSQNNERDNTNNDGK